MYFFDKDWEKLYKRNFTRELYRQNDYQVIPLKNIDNELNNIISFSIQIVPFLIKYLYYKMNIDNGENIVILERNYKSLTNSGYKIFSISNMECLLMNNNNSKKDNSHKEVGYKIIINNEVNKSYSYIEESMKMNLCIEYNIDSIFFSI